MKTETKPQNSPFKELYIEPSLNIFDEFTDIDDPEAYKRYYYRKDLPFDDHIATILESKINFIIGEPGYGKSRLIQELCKNVSDSYLRIDCRQFASQAKIPFSKDITYLFFDGLDEVPPIEFIEVLNGIRQIISDHPNYFVSIACRTHYLQRYEAFLTRFKGAKYAQIAPFNQTQIWRYLLNYLNDMDIAEAIYHRSGSGSGTSVLQTPRYLEAFVKSVLNESISKEEIKSMGKTDIFEKVIYFQLRTELKKPTENLLPLKKKSKPTDLQRVLSYFEELSRPKENVNELFITQRVLEKLAFVMEVYQRNQITLQELVTFLDNAESNINLIFLQYSSIDKFIERTLKKIGDTIVFEHTSFQEYLAAKELVRMSDSSQVIYDLILEKDLQLIYSSWLDVLQYAIELDAEKIAGALCNFLMDNVSRQFDEKLISILMGPGIEKTNEKTKGRLFNAIFTHYQLSGRYLYQKNDALAGLFAGPADATLLTMPQFANYDQNNIRQLTNLILVMGSLHKHGLLPVELHDSWKAFILDQFHNEQLTNEFEILFFGLEHLNAIREIKELNSLIKDMADDHMEVYLDTLSRVDADEMLPFFLEIVSGRPLVKGKDRYIDSLKTVAGISTMLRFLIDETYVKASIFNNNSSYVAFYTFIESIRGLKSEDIQALLEEAVYVLSGDEDYVDYENNLNHFIERAVAYLLVNRDGFLKRLLLRLNFEDIIQEASEAFALNMDEKQFKALYTALHKQRRGYYLLSRLIGHLKVSGIPERQKFLAKLQIDFPILFNENVSTPKQIAETAKQEQQKIYQQFDKQLMRNTPQLKQSVYKFYFDNKEKLGNLVTAEDIRKMTEIIANVMDRVKPEYFKVHMERSGSSVNFTVNDSDWYNFGYFLNAALEFGLDDIVSRNRQKIIRYLPMMNEKAVTGYGRPERFKTLIGTVTNDEVNDLLAFCVSRTDDYLFSAISSFTDFIATNELHAFKPVLQAMLVGSLPEVYERESILKALGALSNNQDDVEYLKAIETSFDKDDETKKKLGELANAILITRFRNEESIKWRFAQLQSRLQAYAFNPHTKGGGLRPYPEWEVELDHPKFGKCLEGINSIPVITGMIDLLKFSFEIRRDKDFIRYSSYLQQIIFDYFMNNNSLFVIKQLRFIVDDKNLKDTTSSFKEHLRSLEISYADNNEVFKTISEPVKKFNYLRSRKYLSIDDSAALTIVIDLALEDLRSFVNDKGYYMTARQLSGSVSRGPGKTKLFNEDILQKTLKVELENSLLRRGLRDTDILREVSLFDDKRLDLYIKYGFVGPVIAELKLLHNKEIQDIKERTEYKTKLIQYKRSVNAEYLYYIVFDVSKPDAASFQAYEQMVTEYNDLTGVKFIYINCPYPGDDVL
jgi:hypothetical protein